MTEHCNESRRTTFPRLKHMGAYFEYFEGGGRRRYFHRLETLMRRIGFPRVAL